MGDIMWGVLVILLFVLLFATGFVSGILFYGDHSQRLVCTNESDWETCVAMTWNEINEYCYTNFSSDEWEEMREHCDYECSIFNESYSSEEKKEWEVERLV